DEDAVAFVVDGTWWVKSARILTGQHAVVLAAMGGRIPFFPVRHSQIGAQALCDYTMFSDFMCPLWAMKTLLRFVVGEIGSYFGGAARRRACSHGGSHFLFPHPALTNLSPTFWANAFCDIHGQYADFLRLFAAVQKPSTLPTLITRWDHGENKRSRVDGQIMGNKGAFYAHYGWNSTLKSVKNKHFHMLDEVAKWPYSFPTSKDFKQAHERGMISCRLFVYDMCISYEHMLGNGSYIGLTPPGDLGSWEHENK
nr:probable rhamnogalacturonate lyase B [Tanacetum cinerariifolium]